MAISYRITWDGFGVSSALRAHVEKLFGNVLQNCTVTPTVDVVLKFAPHAEKVNRNTAIVNVKADGKEKISRSATTDNMYKSINEIASLVDRAIAEKKKGKQIPSPRHHMVHRQKVA